MSWALATLGYGSGSRGSNPVFVGDLVAVALPQLGELGPQVGAGWL